MVSASDTGSDDVGTKTEDGAAGSFARRPFSLLRWFSIVSLAAIIIIGGAVTWFLTHYLTAHMLMRDAEVSRDFLESIVAAEKTRDLLLPFAPRPSADALAPFVDHLPTLPDLVRANLYAADRTVLWSTDKQLIDQRFEHNKELERALAGEIVVQSGRVAADEEKAEHIGLSEKAPRGQGKYFVEAYLPIRDRDNRTVLAVLEIYKLPRALFDAIDKGVYIAWVSSAVGGLLLYLAFFAIVRRGDLLVRAQRERLIEAETLTAIGEMAGAVAHNIRNPLASIRSAAELAREEDRRGVDECLKDIMNETDRLDGWVRELLTAARSTMATLELVDLNRLLQEVLQGNAAEVKRRDIELTFHPALLPHIRGSRAPIGHAVGAIVSNAIQSMPKGGRLRVESRLGEKGRVQIVVEDTGSGMPAHTVRRAFRPFFTTKPNGIGLGLSLAKRILERHAGSIVIESALGRGTRVVLSLPSQG